MHQRESVRWWLVSRSRGKFFFFLFFSWGTKEKCGFLFTNKLNGGEKTAGGTANGSGGQREPPLSSKLKLL